MTRTAPTIVMSAMRRRLLGDRLVRKIMLINSSAANANWPQAARENDRNSAASITAGASRRRAARQPSREDALDNDTRNTSPGVRPPSGEVARNFQERIRTTLKVRWFLNHQGGRAPPDRRR